MQDQNLPTGNHANGLSALLTRVRSCQVCAAHLPLGPRPILRAAPSAHLLLVGQAPGRKVHETGVPWNDPSGDRLRAWLHLSREEFYDESRIAMVPTGLCYPGKVPGKGGDLPPRPECAPLWHPLVRAALPQIQLTLLIGRHAQTYYLGSRGGPSLADSVSRWREFLPEFLPLPHPSPRNLNWFKTHPWFEAEVIPELRERVRACLRTKP